jgi:hypothetical protein
MSKKYELTSETTQTINGETLYRIKALRDFGDVKAGDLGGWVESESNLDHVGDCWVFDNAEVSGDARVFDNAWVYGCARVSGDARVFNNAQVYGYARVFDNAQVYGYARVSGDAWLSGDAWVYKKSHIITFSGFGSLARTTTAFKTEASFHISCGCFKGTLEEFRAAISETHGDNKFGREYKLIAYLIELHFSEE